MPLGEDMSMSSLKLVITSQAKGMPKRTDPMTRAKWVTTPLAMPRALATRAVNTIAATVAAARMTRAKAAATAQIVADLTVGYRISNVGSRISDVGSIADCGVLATSFKKRNMVRSPKA